MEKQELEKLINQELQELYSEHEDIFKGGNTPVLDFKEVLEVTDRPDFLEMIKKKLSDKIKHSEDLKDRIKELEELLILLDKKS